LSVETAGLPCSPSGRFSASAVTFPEGEPIEIALTDRAVAAGIAAHRLGEPPRDRQAEPTAGARGLGHRPEQACPLVLAQARARIRDVEADRERRLRVVDADKQPDGAFERRLRRMRASSPMMKRGQLAALSTPVVSPIGLALALKR
jgi:hypothetical protein